MQRENIKLTIIIFLVVIFSLSATYAFIEINQGNNTTSGTAGCFEVNYSGTTINNASLQSTTDYTKGASSIISLSKNSGCQIYDQAEILVHTNSARTTAPLSDGAMKYKVMQGTTQISNGSISAVTATSEDQVLATVPLTETSTSYTVYLWIDPTVSQGSYHGKSYEGYFYARSTQTSTVK